MAGKDQKKTVDTLTHEEASRKNIPTAEYQSVMGDDDKSPIRLAYERRDRDLDPQLVWRGKDEQDLSDLTVNAPPLYIQEKVHPQVLIDNLQRESREREHDEGQVTADLFDDFNGLPKDADRTEFYQHDAQWTNRMILGDSLQVMASLAEREGLRGKVQCIYLDPPYGIKFNSNFQWSTTTLDVKDGKRDHITREPEQVKAFRDTWRDGIHSYLTYLRDRLTVARDLLTDSGSIFVQIGDENIHRVRALLDDVFGDKNFVRQISFSKTSTGSGDFLPAVSDYLLWFAKDIDSLKSRNLLQKKNVGGVGGTAFTFALNEYGYRRPLSESEKTDPSLLPEGWKIAGTGDLTSSRPPGDFPVTVQGKTYLPGKRFWSTGEEGMSRLIKASRVRPTGQGLSYQRFLNDYTVYPLTNIWTDTVGQNQFGGPKEYVVQTGLKVVQRCIMLATDPGDLVLDPTCGSGTTATVAEQWGRRWITIDTSRVSLALARARIMGACYPYYLLADSQDGQLKEAEITRSAPASQPTSGNISHGFVYERVPHITLKSIANNTEIDVIWDRFQKTLEPLREELNKVLGKSWQEWEIPREPEEDWSDAAKRLHANWWEERIARQKEIDSSIAAKADAEYLHDRPYIDNKKVRVAGPFTVESISPHRVLGVDENDELIDEIKEEYASYDNHDTFVQIVLENLKTAGVQQAHKEDAIRFTSINPWPGEMVCAEGRYFEGENSEGNEKRAAIMIGPEFGTVSRPDLVAAAREAGDAGFEVLITCAFNYEAHATEFEKLGRIPVLLNSDNNCNTLV